ncbi:MAG: M24 family metallopeptidase [Deltaproteobacteria bacterium]|nr:M24 family metallopeptidase [Deltaproteobacteria bacterium]
MDLVWTDLPGPTVGPLFACPEEWSGEDLAGRLARMRELLGKGGTPTYVTVSLDETAWLTGLRCFDEVPHTPVFESFLVLGPEGADLFVRAPRDRVPPELDRVRGFRARPYETFPEALRTLTGRVAVDPTRTTRGVTRTLEAAGVEPVRVPSPVAEAKAVKTRAELRAMERAGVLASRAKALALEWLRGEIEAGRTVTEAEFRSRLEALYAELPGFRGLAFPTIAATGEHGAIVHYSGADDTPLRPGHLFLVDSGIHLDGGTTDATRTVAVGEPSAEQRRVYTRVLRAHIAAARLVFPEGTPGAAIDAVCRSVLWEAGLDYGHGTGHGVGAFLSVHEGPFALAPASRRPASAVPLRAGMVTSIEPGYYRPGFGGVRLENLYRVVETDRTIDGRKALAFSPLTWIPFDSCLTDLRELPPSHRAWLNRYHGECSEKLGL